MTKEQMIAAISSLNTGDSRALEKRGGAFKDLLKEIVNSIPQGGNEPLIVEGAFEEGAGGEQLFTSSGNITLAEATEAFEEGRNVILKGVFGGELLYIKITSNYSLDDCLSGILTLKNTLEMKAVFWE